LAPAVPRHGASIVMADADVRGGGLPEGVAFGRTNSTQPVKPASSPCTLNINVITVDGPFLG
jgi:hypothetical protein